MLWPIILVIIALVMVYGGCEKKTEEQPVEAEPEPEPEPVRSVCIRGEIIMWETLEEPAKNRKSVGEIRRGEEVMFLGESEMAKDLSGREQEYYLIEDSAGNKGWTFAFAIVPDSRAAVITKETVIYSKKSLVSMTDEVFEPMDILAILSEEGDWVKVVSESKSAESWIKKEANLSFAQADLGVAVQVYYALKGSPSDEQKQQILEDLLEKLMKNTEMSKSIFINLLQDELKSLREGETVEVETVEEEKKE
jgi:hypothetical protein